MGGQDCFPAFRTIGDTRAQWAGRHLRLDGSWARNLLPNRNGATVWTLKFIRKHRAAGAKSVTIHLESRRPEWKYLTRPEPDGTILPPEQRSRRNKSNHRKNLQFAAGLRKILPHVHIIHALYENDDAIADSLAWECLFSEPESLPVGWDADYLTKSGNWESELMSPTGKEAFNLRQILTRLATELLAEERLENAETLDPPSQDEITRKAIQLFGGLSCSARLGKTDQSPGKSILSPVVKPRHFKCTIEILNAWAVCKRDSEQSFVPDIIAELVKMELLPGKDATHDASWATTRLAKTEADLFGAPACAYITKDSAMYPVVLPRCVLCFMQQLQVRVFNAPSGAEEFNEPEQGIDGEERVRAALVGLLERRGHVALAEKWHAGAQELAPTPGDDGENHVIEIIVEYLMQCMKNIGMVYQPELAEEIIKVYPLADAQLIHWPIPPYSWQRTVLCSGLREREAPWERIVLELDVTPQEATWIYMLDAEGCIERAMSFGKYIDCTRVMLAQDLLLKAENRVSVDLGFHTIATAVQQSNCPRALAQGILILLDFFLTLLDLERGHVAAAVERWREDLENLGNGYVIFGIPEHISSFDPYSPFYFLQLIEMQYFHRGFFLDHLPILSKLHDIWFDPDYSTLPADSKVCLDIPEDVLVSCNFTVITHLRSMWVASQTELSFRDWANQAPLYELWTTGTTPIHRLNLRITLHKLVAAGVLNDQVMTQTRSLRTFAKAERRKVWAPKQAGWIDEVSTLQELVESVIETFTKDITADVFIRQILYATLDVFFVDCSEPDALESFVFNGSEFNRRYVDTWQPLFVGVNEYNNKPAWIKAGVALFEGLADAYGVKFLPGRSLAEQFESRLFRLANDSDSLSDLLDVLIASGMKPLANAVLNKAMLAAELDVARKLVYPQDEHVVLVHGLVASLQESCAGRGLVTKGGAAALFVEWAYLKLARQKLSSSTRRVKSIPLFLHWFHRYSGFGLSPRLAAMLSKNFFTTSRSAMPFVVAVLPRDTPFHVLINESIFDVCSSNNGENSCLIPFHEILAVSLCLDPTFSRGPLPLDRIPMKGYHVLWTKIFPDGSHLSGRVLDAQRKRDEWNAAAQENARVVLEEVGDMIDSVRVGTASTYTSQRMFPPRIQPTIEAWRTTLRKAAGAAPLSILAEEGEVWSSSWGDPRDLNLTVPAVSLFRELGEKIDGKSRRVPQPWEMSGMEILSQTLSSHGESTAVIESTTSDLDDVLVMMHWLEPRPL